VLVVAAGAAWWWRAYQESERRDAAITAALRDLVGGPRPAWIAGERHRRTETWASVRRAYREHRNRPLWIRGTTLQASGYQLATALADVKQDGLDPATYGIPSIREALPDPDPAWGEITIERARMLAELDVRLTAAFLRYARDVHDGRMPARGLDPDWRALRDTLDAVAALKQALQTGPLPLPRRLHTLLPADSAYLALRDALKTYRGLAAAGGWKAIANGPRLKRGSHDARCVALRRRLAKTGDLADSTGDDAYDLALMEGVRRFQARHGLPATGLLGDATVAELNVPAAERVRTLEMNLERARWLPSRLPEPHVLVNVPDFRLRLVEGSVDSMTMRVVVGKKSNPTPIFSDVITYMELNPTWRVPRRILVEEILPGYARDKDYFVKHGMRVFYLGVRPPLELDPKDVDWKMADQDTFRCVVSQDAGPENPLGRIKFMCPNEYDVYLHDTSARTLFREDARDLSHGCVRVERPLELAQYLLRPAPQAAPDSIGAILDSLTWRLIGLKRRMPVHVVYRTAWVDSAGLVQFRPDVYGLDRRLGEALKTGKMAAFDLNEGVIWAPDTSAVAKAASAAAAMPPMAVEQHRRP
jgi:murein L,D-transpeptidase YcbB/YkuD